MPNPRSCPRGVPERAACRRSQTECDLEWATRSLCDILVARAPPPANPARTSRLAAHTRALHRRRHGLATGRGGRYRTSTDPSFSYSSAHDLQEAKFRHRLETVLKMKLDLALAVTSAFSVATVQMAGMDMGMGMDMGSPPEAMEAGPMPAPGSVRMPSCWGVNTAWISARWMVTSYRVAVNMTFTEICCNARSGSYCKNIHYLHARSLGDFLHRSPALTLHMRCVRVKMTLAYAGGCFPLCSHGGHDAVDRCRHDGGASLQLSRHLLC